MLSKNVLLNWYSSMKIIDFESKILALFDTSPLHRFSKFNNFHWLCWFFRKNLSNFVTPAWKLDSPYYHTAHLAPLKRVINVRKVVMQTPIRPGTLWGGMNTEAAEAKLSIMLGINISKKWFPTILVNVYSVVARVTFTEIETNLWD